jgi:hypothetical protein
MERSKTYVDICYDNATRACTFTSARSGWTVDQLDESFKPIWQVLQHYKAKTAFGVTGAFRKGQKCLVLMVIGQTIEEIVDLKCWHGRPVLNADGNLDFALFLGDSLAMVQLNNIVRYIVNTQYVLNIVRQMMAAPESLMEIHIMQTKSALRDMVFEMMDVGDLIDADEMIDVRNLIDAEDLIPQPQVQEVQDDIEPENLEPTEAPLDKEAHTLLSVYRETCDYVKMYATNKTPENKTFVDIWKRDGNVTELVMKKTILIALMIPYLRMGPSQAAPLNALKLFMDNVTMKLDDFNVDSWVTDSNTNAAYIMSVKERKKSIIAMINAPDKLEAISESVQSLNDKCGFRYGVKFLATPNLENEFKRKTSTKLLHYSKQFLESIANDILDYSGSRNWKRIIKTNIVEELVAENPHSIVNALTFYTDENLMDLHPLVLMKVNGKYGYDIFELVTMILAQQGRNEHMGFPDIPGKDKIWKDNTDLFRIINQLGYITRKVLKGKYAFLRPLLQELNDTAKAIVGDELNVLQEKVTLNKSVLSAMSPEHWAITSKLLEHPEGYAYVALLKVVIEQEIKKTREIMYVMRDINLLHLVGYLGFIMLSDKPTSHSQDADQFDITNKCKALFEKYILRLFEDDDIKEKYYYANGAGTDETSVRKYKVLSNLKDLQLHGKSLSAIINDHACLHGIGGNLIALYLQTLHELNAAIDSGAIKKSEVPVYITPARLRPLSMFRHVSNGRYIYVVKSGDTENTKLSNILDEKKPAHDGVDKDGNINYHVQYFDLYNGMKRSWAGQAFFELSTPKIASLTPQNFYKKRIYKPVQFVSDYTTPAFVTNYMTSSTLDLNALFRGTDMFTDHRIQHFTIFTRYTIDFNNMIQEYIMNGILRVEGDQTYFDLDGKEKPYVYPEGYPDLGDSKDELKNYLYAYHLNYAYSDEQDAKDDFTNKFGYHLNVNSAVARDFDDEGRVQRSEMTYYLDVLGKVSDIYDRDVRTGTKGMFGVINRNKNGTLITDDFVEKLGLNSTRESSRFKSFNRMVISKCMISKALLKIMDPNSVSPFFTSTMGQIDLQSIIETAVDRQLFYLNIKGNMPTIQDSSQTLQLKFFKVVLMHTFLYSIVQFSIIPAMASTPEFATFRLSLAQQFFVSPFDLMNKSGIDQFGLLDGFYDKPEMRKRLHDGIKYVIDEIYKSLHAFLRMFQQDAVPSTYDLHAAHFNTIEPILKDINTFLNKGDEGLKDLAKTLSPNGDDAYHLSDIYCDAQASFFPDSDSSICDRPSYLSDLVDIAMKYSVIQTFAMPLQALVVLFDKLSMLEKLPSSDDILMISKNLQPLYAKLKSTNGNYEALLDDETVLDFIGTTATTNRFGMMIANIIGAICFSKDYSKQAIATLCIAAYEHIPIYSD